MKIVILKKCFVNNRLYYAGDTADVADASIYEGVAKAIGEEKKPEPEVIKIKTLAKPKTTTKTVAKKGLKK